MSDGPIDNVFRRPYEVATVAVAMVGAGLILLAPRTFMLDVAQAWATALLLVGLAAARCGNAAADGGEALPWLGS